MFVLYAVIFFFFLKILMSISMDDLDLMAEIIGELTLCMGCALPLYGMLYEANKIIGGVA